MCTVPKRSFLSGTTSLRFHRGTRMVDRERRHFLSAQQAQRPAVQASRRASSREQTASRGTCRFSCFYCYFYCESVSLGSSVLSCRRAQCVVWVVGPQYPFRSQNVVNLHTSKMSTKLALLCTLTCWTGGIAAFSDKKHPRTLKCGWAGLRCGSRGFDVPFIYPFST